MQKKLIVLALAAAFSAPAFAETTVYGVVDAVAANISADGKKSDTSVWSGGLAGSRLGVKSSEDMGDGMKASIVLEYGLDTATSAGIASARQQYVSVDGGFGKVAAGYLQTTGYDFGRFDPTAGSLISPLGNIIGKSFLIGNGGSLKRLPRTLAYTTPEMGGFTIAANYSTAADTTTNVGVAESSITDKATAYLVSANYVAGSFAASLVHASKTAASTAAVAAVPASLYSLGSPAVAAVVGAKTTESAIGASYDLGMAKLFATYQTNKVENAADSDSVMSVSASAPFGASTVVVTYADASMKAQGTNKDVSGYTVAYLNNLTKTSTLYVAYSAMSQDSATKTYSVANNAVSGLANGTDSKMIALGLNKKF
jgi:predicted porin